MTKNIVLFSFSIICFTNMYVIIWKIFRYFCFIVTNTLVLGLWDVLWGGRGRLSHQIQFTFKHLIYRTNDKNSVLFSLYGDKHAHWSPPMRVVCVCIRFKFKQEERDFEWIKVFISVCFHKVWIYIVQQKKMETDRAHAVVNVVCVFSTKANIVGTYFILICKYQLN